MIKSMCLVPRYAKIVLCHCYLANAIKKIFSLMLIGVHCYLNILIYFYFTICFKIHVCLEARCC